MTSTAAPQFPSLPVQCEEYQSNSLSISRGHALGEQEHQAQHGLHTDDWTDDDFIER